MTHRTLRRHDRGITMIEIIVASFILILLLSAVFTALISLQKQYEVEVVRREALMRMQGGLDTMSRDIRESNNGLVRVATFNDANFPTPTQSIVVMPTARSTANGNFVVVNGQAQWQGLIIYAAYWNATTNTGEIRRYIATGAIPVAYTTVGAATNITVTATNISLDGFLVARNPATAATQDWEAGYKAICTKVDYMAITQGVNPATFAVDLRCRGNLQKVINMDMGTGSRGRN